MHHICTVLASDEPKQMAMLRLGNNFAHRQKKVELKSIFFSYSFLNKFPCLRSPNLSLGWLVCSNYQNANTLCHERACVLCTLCGKCSSIDQIAQSKQEQFFFGKNFSRFHFISARRMKKEFVCFLCVFFDVWGPTKKCTVYTNTQTQTTENTDYNVDERCSKGS